MRLTHSVLESRWDSLKFCLVSRWLPMSLILTTPLRIPHSRCVGGTSKHNALGHCRAKKKEGGDLPKVHKSMVSPRRSMQVLPLGWATFLTFSCRKDAAGCDGGFPMMNSPHASPTTVRTFVINTAPPGLI